MSLRSCTMATQLMFYGAIDRPQRLAFEMDGRAGRSRPVRRRRRAAAAAISATPPPPTVRARRAAAAAADIFVDRRGGVTVPNSSLWLCVRAKLHICLLIVCWTDIRMKTLILSSFCSYVPMFSKAILAVVATSEPPERVFSVAACGVDLRSSTTLNHVSRQYEQKHYFVHEVAI